MRILLRILLTLFIILFFSCDKQGLFVNCADCTKEEPVKTDLLVKLGSNLSANSIIINVYEGNLEDSIIFKTIQIAGNSTTIPVTLNKKYTLTASYYIPGNHYVVVDSATPRVRYDKEQCDDPCFFVYDRTVDLRLKYIN